MFTKIRINAKIIPFALLGLCWISYGLFIHRLGFYWDDWPSIWFYHNFGAESYLSGFSVDRPLLAWVFILTTSLMGESVLAWQIFAMLTRWLAVLALWWSLRLLWPKHTQQVTAVAFLFAVYPGFRQHYISVTYGNAFLVFAVYLSSYGSMLLAYRKPRWFWPLISLSLLASTGSIFISEYFFGLELLRPVILWMIQNQRARPLKERLWRASKRWSPYLAMMIVFLVWRLFLHQTPRGKVTIFEDLLQSPFWTLFDLGKTILSDMAEVSVIAWAKSVDILDIFKFDLPVIVIYFGALIVSGLLSYFLLVRISKDGAGESRTKQDKPWAVQATLLGLYALLVAGWPFWLTNLHIDLFFPWDRFTMPMMVGAALLFAGLADFLRRWRPLSIGLVAVLISTAVGMHFHDTMAYRQEWLSQKDFFWQLAWRAPGIEPGTTLLTSEIPFIYYSDNSLTAPLNWTYAPDNKSLEMSYILADIEARLGADLVPDLEPGTPVLEEYRATSFSGSTSQALLLFYDPPRCLKVMDPVYDLNLPYKPLYVRQALPLARPDLIQKEISSPAHPPEHIFGAEPVHNWCYYFEKTELAVQFGDWQLAVQLADQAMQIDKSFNRKTAPELLPFIKAYAFSGQWEQAVALSQKAFEAGDKMQYLLCSAWYYIQLESEPGPEGETAVEKINQEFDCSSVY
ncbi:hypothetical protein ACFLZW_02395 [Chloroflexota bacterium]